MVRAVLYDNFKCMSMGFAEQVAIREIQNIINEEKCGQIEPYELVY
jgi:hypothetical protein